MTHDHARSSPRTSHMLIVQPKIFEQIKRQCAIIYMILSIVYMIWTIGGYLKYEPNAHTNTNRINFIYSIEPFGYEYEMNWDINWEGLVRAEIYWKRLGPKFTLTLSVVYDWLGYESTIIDTYVCRNASKVHSREIYSSDLVVRVHDELCIRRSLKVSYRSYMVFVLVPTRR